MASLAPATDEQTIQSSLLISDVMNLSTIDNDIGLHNVEDILNVEQTLLAEVQRATANTTEDREEWTLQGNSEQQTSELLDRILATPATQFGREPKISIVGNIALDMGGPFRQYVANAFNSLLSSDEIFSDHSSELRSFREHPLHVFTYQQNRYIVLGKLFYWFVIIHKCIPYPHKLNPAIVAFAIHDTIPLNVVPHANRSVMQILNLIEGYNSRTSINVIDEIVKEWLENLGIPLSDFMNALSDRNKGSLYFMKGIAMLAVINNCQQAFDYFRMGFQSGRNFISVKVSKSFV